MKGDLGDSHSIHYHLISFAGEYMRVHVNFSLLFYSKHIIIIILAIKKSLVFKVSLSLSSFDRRWRVQVKIESLYSVLYFQFWFLFLVLG